VLDSKAPAIILAATEGGAAGSPRCGLPTGRRTLMDFGVWWWLLLVILVILIVVYVIVKKKQKEG